MRHNPATVVVLAGQVDEQVLAAIGRSLNVVLIRPESPTADAGDGRGSAGAGRAGTGTGRAGTGTGRGSAGIAGTGVEAAAGALRRAAGISAPYVVVAADPLGGVAAAWQAMWDITVAARGSDEFELRAAEALAAWRAKRFELPDYYLVLAEETAAGGAGASAASGPVGAAGFSGASRSPAAAAAGGGGAGEGRADFYLGPLRSVRPNRVTVAAGASPAAQADALLSELASLRHGPWWPPLDEILRTARGFYPGSLAESAAGPATLLA